MSITFPIDFHTARNLRRHFDSGDGTAKADAERHALALSKRGLWECACAWDGVSPDEHFVTFSEGNPYAEAYDEAVYINPYSVQFMPPVRDARSALEQARTDRRRLGA